MQFDAVIFDMDGTLVDSEVLWVVQEGALLARRGYEYTRDIQKLSLGMGIRDMLLMFKERFPIEESIEELHEELVNSMYDEIRTKLQVKPGAQDLLEYVAALGIPYCIASGSSIAIIEAVLKSQNWNHLVEHYFSAEQVERGKPEPDVFLYAAEQLGVEPEKCLVLEDSPNGVRAAIAAGMTVFAIPDSEDIIETINELTPNVFPNLHRILDHIRNS